MVQAARGYVGLGHIVQC